MATTPSIATAEQIRAFAYRDVTISLGTIRLRRKDFITMFFDGSLPLPALEAMVRMIGMSNEIKEDPSKILRGTEADRKAMIESLRQFAVGLVMQPIFVMEDDGDPTHVPVEVLTADDLKTIWQVGSEMLGLAEIQERGMTAEQASRFRGTGADTHDAPAHDGQNLRAETVLVDGHDQRDVFSI